MATFLFLQGYEDEAEDDDADEISEDISTKEADDEVDNYDDRPRVTLRQDDVNQHYEIKEEIGK